MKLRKLREKETIFDHIELTSTASLLYIICCKIENSGRMCCRYIGDDWDRLFCQCGCVNLSIVSLCLCEKKLTFLLVL